MLSGAAIAAGNAHFLGSWVPINWHPVSGAEGCRPQLVKSLPAVRETRVQSLGWEDLLEKEMVTHSGILAWRIPWTEEPDGLQSSGLQRVGHESVTEYKAI